MIRFENVCKSYDSNLVLDHLSFEIEAGEFTVLIGPSGCGKTTTLKTINRLIPPDEGRVLIDGEDIAQTDPMKLRRGIGYVIQQIGLFPNMTVEKNICVVPKLLKYSKERCDQVVREMLALANMPYDEFAHKYPSQLSGGQQQRIGVLRALAVSPPIVLMDEPFGALDPMTRIVLQEEISQLQRKLRKTIVFVTHDMDEALMLADRIIFMDKGQIVQSASPEEMLENPASDLVRSFLCRRDNGVENRPKTAADFMRSPVVTTYMDRGVLESLELMARRRVDTLIVKNPDETYAGVVSIQAIRNSPAEGGIIGPLINRDNAVSRIDEDAQTCFDKLFSGNDNYVVVLNPDETVAGIVTKTSAGRALADIVWGGRDG